MGIACDPEYLIAPMFFAPVAIFAGVKNGGSLTGEDFMHPHAWSTLMTTSLFIVVIVCQWNSEF